MDQNQANNITQNGLAGGLSEEGFTQLREQSIKSKFRMSLFSALGGSVLFAGAGAAIAAAGSLGLIGLLAIGVVGVACIYLSQRESFRAMEADQELGAIKIATHANGLGQNVQQQQLQERLERNEVLYPQNERKGGVPWAATVRQQAAARTSTEINQRT